MKKTLVSSLLAFAGILGAAPAFAAEGAASSGATSYYIACVVAAAFAMMGASGLAALGQGRAISAAVEGIARQPNAAGKIQVNLIIGLALIESLAIYVFVIALILFFANPFQAFVG